MNLLYKISLMMIFTLCFISGLLAQGTLKGIVTDSLSEKPLIGANVFLLGTSLGSAANIEGEYSIHPIPEGTYKLKVSYIGYKAKEIIVIISSNKVLELNVSLALDVVMGDEVIVTGQMMGQISAINQQRTSNTIMNVVSEEKIQELPDVNAAEVIGRMPGVSIMRSGGEANKVILRGLDDRFTTVTIDGIKIPSTEVTGRGLDLSTISQSSLAGIELYKALTPDKDADGLAGSINLVTKKAPVERLLKLEMKGGYNNLEESLGQYEFIWRYGERFFDNLLGVQITGNVESRIRSNERINIDYDQNRGGGSTFAITDFSVDYSDEIRKRNGISLLFDLNTPDGGTIKLNSVFGNTTRNFLFSNRNYPVGTSESSVDYTFRDRVQDIETMNSALTGNNIILGLNINWGISYAQSGSDYPYDYELYFREPSLLGTSGMGTDESIQNLKDHPENIIPFAYNNFNAATLYSAEFRTQKNFEKEKTAFLKIADDYNIGSYFAGTIELGGKYKSRERSNVNSSSYSPYYLGYWRPYEILPDGTLREKKLMGTQFEAFYLRYLQTPSNTAISFAEFLNSPRDTRNIFDTYLLNPILNREWLRDWYRLNKNGVNQNGSQAEYGNDPTVKRNNYDIIERVSAAYLMNTLNLGQLITFIAGVRVENEKNDFGSTYSPVNTGGFPFAQDLTRDTTVYYSETIWLPNFHINIKPTEFISIRLATYKALARPDFDYRLASYFAWRGRDVSSNKELEVGNPKLKTAEAWNYEINTSFFGNEIGLISLSAFYKEIKNQHHLLTQINTSGDTLLQYLGLDWHSLHDGTYQLTVPYNSPHPTKVWGFEFEHQINFTFLPGLLKNIVLSYNASLVKSETYLISATIDTIYVSVPGFPVPIPTYKDRPIEVKQQLEHQPEFYGNISLGYDIGGFSGRISLFHQAEYNNSFSASRTSDQIINSLTKIDIALRQDITENISLRANLSNITNVKDENSIYNRVKGWKILNTSEYYGFTTDFGLVVTL